MKNAFSRIVRTCAYAVIGGGLMAGALLAGSVNDVTLTLPHTVAVGSATLPSGNYTLSSFAMGGQQYFIVRNEKGSAMATLEAQPLFNDTDKTQVTFSKDGDAWHFDRLDIAGDESYQFVNK